MSKPFTMVAAIVFFIVAAIHVYRGLTGFPLIVGAHVIPVMLSWVVAFVSGLLGIMLIAEARR